MLASKKTRKLGHRLHHQALTASVPAQTHSLDHLNHLRPTAELDRPIRIHSDGKQMPLRLIPPVADRRPVGQPAACSSRASSHGTSLSLASRVHRSREAHIIKKISPLLRPIIYTTSLVDLTLTRAPLTKFRKYGIGSQDAVIPQTSA